jgi:hypothetical protein
MNTSNDSDDAIQRAEGRVPGYLVKHCARLLCEGMDHCHGEPSSDCLITTHMLLAQVYWYNPLVSPERPCMACKLTAPDSCLFHQGYDHAVFTGGAQSWVPVRPGRWRRAWRAWSAALLDRDMWTVVLCCVTVILVGAAAHLATAGEWVRALSLVPAVSMATWGAYRLWNRQ